MWVVVNVLPLRMGLQLIVSPAENTFLRNEVVGPNEVYLVADCFFEPLVVRSSRRTSLACRKALCAR